MEADKQALVDNTDKSQVNKLFEEYEWSREKLSRYDNFSIDSVVKAAELFNKMAVDISWEFKTAVVDTDNFTIRFPWHGRSISFPVRMVASMYNLHPGMFGFGSSFSTHEAYTEDNYRVRIGIAEDNDSEVLIDFGKLNEF